MALGLEPARQVDGQRAAPVDGAVLEYPLALTFGGQTHRLVDQQFRDGEAVVHLSEIEVVDADAGLVEGGGKRPRRPFEIGELAARHGQDVLHVRGGPEAHGPRVVLRNFVGCDHHRGRSVGDQRAVGDPQGRSHHRVLVRDRVAELETDVLAHVGEGVVDTIGVVLGGDGGQGAGVVAELLEVGGGVLGEDLGERHPGLFLLVGGATEGGGDVGRGVVGHLLCPDDERDLGFAGLDGVDGRVQGSRTRRTGVLDPGCRLPPQALIGLDGQRGGEPIGHHAAVEVTEPHGVDVTRIEPGVGDGTARHLDDHLLERVFEPPEGDVRPADHARIHGVPFTRSDDAGSVGRPNGRFQPHDDGTRSRGPSRPQRPRAPESTSRCDQRAR